MQRADFPNPDKHLIEILPKHSGRDHTGHVSIRHQGGRHKRFYRQVDFKRDKRNVFAQVLGIEYDPNRTSRIALLQYADGERRYILCPMGLNIGDRIVCSEEAEIKAGNALPLVKIPIGTAVHNVELYPGQGGKIIRSAGNAAVVLAKEDKFTQLRMPSGEIRRIANASLASVGQLGNIDWRNLQVGTAGRARRRGKRPEVRGVAQNPRSHPHGGGEGRSGIGLTSPKSPWGKRTLGKKTRRLGKYSNSYIIKRRK